MEIDSCCQKENEELLHRKTGGVWEAGHETLIVCELEMTRARVASLFPLLSTREKTRCTTI